MSNCAVVLCTTNSIENAKETANILIKEQLCACVNIIPAVTSIYSWKNKIEKDNENLMIIKTKKDLFKKLEARIKELHPYEVPEIISLDITKGSKKYLDWISENTI